MSERPSIIPTDQPSIYDQLTTLSRAAIVRPNNPPRGVAGFLFDFDSDEFMELISEITDNPIEDNTNLADNIALLPERVTLKGLIAELTDRGATAQTQLNVPDPLPLVPGLFPPFSPAANLSFSSGVGMSGLSGDLAVGIGASGAATGAVNVNGAVGPVHADAIVRTVTGELAGVISVSVDVLNAINSAVNNVVKSLANGNAATSGAIAAAINTAVGNIIGSGLTPGVQALVTQSVNSALSTTAGAAPAGPAGAAASLYEYYLNRAQVQPGTSAQGLAQGYFYQMWRARQLFSVETPWGFINDMAILSVRASQPEETKSSTEFTVVFKKIRVARSVTINTGQLAGRNVFQAQAAAPAQQGNAGLTPATPAQESSWAATLLGQGGNP